jgi:hypothetical protein
VQSEKKIGLLDNNYRLNPTKDFFQGHPVNDLITIIREIIMLNQGKKVKETRCTFHK